MHAQIREVKIVRRKVTTEMKALVLGGAGVMYSETTRDLVNTSNFTEITMRAPMRAHGRGIGESNKRETDQTT